MAAPDDFDPDAQIVDDIGRKWDDPDQSAAVARDLNVKVGSSSSAKASMLRRAKGIAAKVGTAAGAKTSPAVLRPLTTRAGVADSAKATGFTTTKGLAAKAGTASSAHAIKATVTQGLDTRAAVATGVVAEFGTSRTKVLAVTVPTVSSVTARVGLARAVAGTAPTAAGGRATRVGRSAGSSVAVGMASSARATTISILGGLHGRGKLPIAASARGQHRVMFTSSGFDVGRSIRARLPVAVIARGDTTTTTEAFYVARAMRAKVGMATSAAAGLRVAYFAGGQLNVLRPIRAKAPNTTRATATTFSQFDEAFLVRRAMRGKVTTASSAKATVVTGQSGPGFIVARALVGKLGTAASLKATLLRVHGDSLVKLPAATSAKATTLRRGAGMPVRVPTASSARATGRIARPLLARAAIASSFKPVFLLTQHAGQKSYAANSGTAASAKASLTFSRPLVARSATASSGRVRVTLRLAERGRAPVATSAWAGPMLKTRGMGAAHVSVATGARAVALTILHPAFTIEGSAAMASSAHARVNVFPALGVPGGDRGILVYDVYDEEHPWSAEDLEAAKRHMGSERALGRERLPSPREPVEVG